MEKTWFTLVCAFASAWLVSCHQEKQRQSTATARIDSIEFRTGYSEVNGIRLYYEIHGKGQPLVLIHGGGSTIQSSFERVIPSLAKNFRIIALELQNHGRSSSRNIPETFEQDAEDVFTLMNNLNISKANFLGFSNGGHTLFELALHHAELIDKLIIASSPYKRSGFIPGFFESMPESNIGHHACGFENRISKSEPRHYAIAGHV